MLGWRADTALGMYWFIAAFFFVGYVVARRIIASPVGRILTAIRDNEQRALATGNAVHLYKLCSFTIAAAYAGLAGGLLGIFQNYMPPDAFAFETSGQLLIQTVIGGAATLLGPLVGGAVWIYLRETLQHSLGLDTSWRLILGFVFVLLVSFLRQGIVGEVMRLVRRPPPVLDVDHDESPVPRGDFARLRRRRARPGDPRDASGLTKRFGGLVANENVNFQVNEFEVRGLIGPNGAGKSTFFRMLAGEMKPSAGAVLFRGQDITNAGVCNICQQGMAKSYQINQLFDRLTVRENLLIPTLAERRGRFRLDLLRSLRSVNRVEEGVEETMRLVNLTAPRRYAGLPARLWREAAARDRAGARHQPEGPAAGRAAGRHEPERAGQHGPAAVSGCAKAAPWSSSSTTWTRCSSWPTGSPCWSKGGILVEGTPEDVRVDPAVQEAYLGGVDEHAVAQVPAAMSVLAGRATSTPTMPTATCCSTWGCGSRSTRSWRCWAATAPARARR